MSWLFSRALVEDCYRRLSLAGKQSALSNWIGIADAFSSSDRMTDYSPSSLYGMTFVPLTAERGAGPLMLCLEASLVRHTAMQQPGEITRTIFGLKCAESWQMSLPGTYLPRTSAEMQLTKRRTTASRWVTKPDALNYPRRTWVQTTFGTDVGYLHTPTTKANYCADSMQKWPSCQAWRKVFGAVTPEAHEYLMGWPIGWTDLKPLGTDKSHCAPLKHGAC